MDNSTIASGNASISASDYEDERILLMVIYILPGIIIMIVNALTLIAIIFYERTYENYIVLIGSLSMADALLGLSMILYGVHVQLYMVIDFIFTVFVISMMNLSTFASHWHTVAVSIDRWIAVHYALNYHSIMSPFRLKLLVATAWIIGFVETVTYNLLRLAGWLNSINRAVSILMAMHFITIFIVNAVIYGKLWQAARRQRRQIAQLQQQQDNTTGINKATVMVMVIVALFGFLWGPASFGALWFGFSGNINITLLNVGGSSELGGYCYSLVNCIVYVHFSKSLRKLLSKAFTCRQCVCEAQETLFKLFQWY